MPNICNMGIWQEGIILKKIVAGLLGFFVLLLAGTGMAADRQPLRVALLPVQAAPGWVDEAALRDLSDRMKREFAVPLNDIVKAVEFVPISAEVAGTVWRDKDMRELADALSADVVLCLTVNNFSNRYYGNWEGDYCLESVATLHLAGYDRKRDKVLSEDVSNWYNDGYVESQTARNLALTGLDTLFGRLHFHELIFPLA